MEARTWLIHWALFVFFNHVRGRDVLVDLFFQPNYINTIQNGCPWVVRYLIAAVMNNKRRKNYMKDLVAVVQQVGGAVPELDHPQWLISTYSLRSRRVICTKIQ